MLRKIIKRDGREVEYNQDNIVNAILSAMSNTKKGCDNNLAKKIALEIEHGEKEKIHVEEI